MKKFLLIISTFCAVSLTAQDGDNVSNTGKKQVLIFQSSGEEMDFTSKNGHQILPKAGDWALGINALPILQYVGNVANARTDNTSADFSYANKELPAVTVYGKYFIADDLAYRASANIQVFTNRNRFRIDDDNSVNPDDFIHDIEDHSRKAITLSAGLEKRKGQSRVQGVYGAEAFIHFTTNDTRKYSYGNQITQSNQEPASTSFPNTSGVPGSVSGYRITESNIGNIFATGLRGFIGVEYFVAPKISIGGEFYMEARYSISGTSSVTYEAYEGTQDSVLEYSTFRDGNRSFNMGLNNTGGAINMFLYF